LNPNDGWTDAIDTLHGDEPTYTHWDCFQQRWERNSGLRMTSCC
jgi:exonuclease III